MKPNFLVIGAAKSGTTSLCDSLGQHPDVFISDPKEPRFFSFDGNFAKGMAWYEQFFAGAETAKAIGEGSANYTMLPEFPETSARIARHLPAAKLIYIVRHPVDRMVSTWMMLARNRPGFPPFEEAVRRPDLRQYFVDRSRYWYQIQAYRKHFPEDQILVLFFEDFIANPVTTLKKTFTFLQVDDRFQPRMGIRKNASTDYRNDKPWASSIKRARVTRLLKKLLPKHWVRSARIWTTRPAATPPEIPPETRVWLSAQVKDDIEAFLSHYGQPQTPWSLL